MIFGRKKKGVIFIYELDSTTNHRIDFTIGKKLIEEIIYEPLVNDFNTFQIIQPESTFVTPLNELDANGVKYWTKTISKNKIIVSDLIIPPMDTEHLYRFISGNYMYLAFDTDKSIEKETIIEWLNTCVPNRSQDIDSLYAGQINDYFYYLSGLELLLITNYDSNRDIGIVVRKKNFEKVKSWIERRLNSFNIMDFEIETYNNCKRLKVLE